MEKIFIIGASGFAKELCNLIYTEKLFEIAGFIDYNPVYSFLDYNDIRFPIISESEFLANKTYKGSNVAIGIGNPSTIEKIFLKYTDYVFPNVISKYAIIGNDIVFGKGNVVTQNVIMTTNIKIGDGNIFNLATTIGHDVDILNYNVFNPAVNISGGVKVGNSNLIGVGAIVLQYLSIGEKNIIGGASLVTKNILNDKLIVGIPGKEILRNG